MSPQMVGSAILLAIVLLAEIRSGQRRQQLVATKKKEQKAAVALVRRYLS